MINLYFPYLRTLSYFVLHVYYLKLPSIRLAEWHTNGTRNTRKMTIRDDIICDDMRHLGWHQTNVGLSSLLVGMSPPAVSSLMKETGDTTNVRYTQSWPYISHKIQRSGLFLAQLLGTTPFVATPSPLLLAICVTILRSILDPMLLSRSDGKKITRKWRHGFPLTGHRYWSFVNAKDVAAKGSHLLSPSSQIRYSTQLFYQTKSTTYTDDFTIHPTNFRPFSVWSFSNFPPPLTRPFLLTVLRFPTIPTSVSGQ